jgi:catechol 2,3-dioxygenase-like lactoylglutathione lyase family enzyme
LTVGLVELGFADAPVLAKAAAEIAARGAEAQDLAAGQKMIQRFFLDGVDRETRGCSIAEGVEFAGDVLANVTETGLSFADAAKARTKGTENLAVVLRLPPQSFLHKQNIPRFSIGRKGATRGAWPAFPRGCAIVGAMSRIKGITGMRHIALKVKDAARSKQFYRDLFGMAVVWEPDRQNIYLSSGCDNLAIHEVPESFLTTAVEKQLDHLGFVVDSIERVKELEGAFRSQGVEIVQPFKVHRDGSASFYCADPDGIIIQLLYEPTLSAQKIT